MSNPIYLYDLEYDDLVDLITEWGFERYRADQVWGWLYQRLAPSVEQMANIPGDLRTMLAERTHMDGLELVREMASSDGETRKYLFRLPDGEFIETVLMEYSGVRRTACISTQAGCAMGCVFCATGQMGFARHLTRGEIIAQSLYVARTLADEDERLSNVVLMGMGEPFHNYDESLAAVRRMMDDRGLNIGQRHITVSTVGLVPAIKQFANEDLQVRLAISLHAATDDERGSLLPVNKRYPLADLVEAAHDYVRTTGRRVSFEWALIDGENDTPTQAHELGQLLSGLLCHVNVIPLNPTEGYHGDKPSQERVDGFIEILRSYGIPATVRVRRGIDINAGCGQLKAAVMRQTDDDYTSSNES